MPRRRRTLPLGGGWWVVGVHPPSPAALLTVGGVPPPLPSPARHQVNVVAHHTDGERARSEEMGLKSGYHSEGVRRFRRMRRMRWNPIPRRWRIRSVGGCAALLPCRLV